MVIRIPIGKIKRAIKKFFTKPVHVNTKEWVPTKEVEGIFEEEKLEVYQNAVKKLYDRIGRKESEFLFGNDYPPPPSLQEIELTLKAMKLREEEWNKQNEKTNFFDY